MKRRQTICAVMAMMAISGTAHAAVILVDDPVFGVDSVIRDLCNNMDFLALDFTDSNSGYTYAQVLDELGPGGVFEGWSVASKEDLLLLGSSADIVHESTDPDMLARAEELRDWFGNVDLSSSHEYCRGLVVETRVIDGFTYQLAFSIGRRFNVTPHEVDFRISGYGHPDNHNECTYLVRVSPVASIDVSPLTYDFGNVEKDTSSTVMVAVSNVGGSQLTVDNIALQAGSSLAFDLTLAPALPAIVPPGGSLAGVEITYTPSAVELSSGVLEISSDDPDEPIVAVVLDGAGVVTDEAHTPEGEKVRVVLKDKRTGKERMAIEYLQVTKAGETKKITRKAKAEDKLPLEFKLCEHGEVYEVETTAEYVGKITICIDYSDSRCQGSPEKLRLRKKIAAEEWKDITTSKDTVNKKICGEVDSLSLFGLFELDVFGLVNGLIDEVLLLNLQQGIENSLDAKLDAAMKAVDEFNANNDVAAINAMEAFINAVTAQRGNKISETDADALIATAQHIIDLLNVP